MKEEINVSLRKFSNALTSLKEGINSTKDELDKDGVIQRFEFTVELLWKILRIHLEDQGVICKTPKECLKQAFRLDLIDKEEIFLNMLADRNRTSHIYSKEESEQIFARIRDEYVDCFTDILKKLK